MERETAVYRLYDGNGALIYVGIAYEVAVRLSHHERHKPWWRQVARVEVSWWPCRETAMREEERAIRDEDPRDNIRDVPSARRDGRTLTDEEVRAVSASFVARVEHHVEGMTELEAMREVTDLIEMVEAEQEQYVAAALRDGSSWAAIGRAVGMTRQGARKRYGHLQVVG